MEKNKKIILLVIMVLLVIVIGAVSIYFVTKDSGDNNSGNNSGDNSGNNSGDNSGNNSSGSDCVPNKNDWDDEGYDGPYKGWYDTTGCGKKNRYCRWVGAVHVDKLPNGTPDPKTSRVYKQGTSKSNWVCTTDKGNYDDFSDNASPWPFTLADRSDVKEE